MPKYINVGVTASRNPANCDFLPPIPVFIEDTASGRAVENRLRKDLENLYMQRIKRQEAANQTQKEKNDA